MSQEKRYYWIKLKESFMTGDTIDYLMSQEDGANYIVLYQMLCVKTLNTNGVLASKIGEMIIPYDVNKIQRECKWFSVDTIRVAMNLYKNLGLIYEDINGTLAITGYEDMVGSETKWAKQKRNQSKKKSALSGGNKIGIEAETGVENFHPDIDIEIDKDIEKDKDKEIDINTKKKTKKSRFTPPSVEEIAAYIQEKGYNIDAEYFHDYYARIGWKVGRNKTDMQDWKATIRMWHRNTRSDNEKQIAAKAPEQPEGMYSINKNEQPRSVGNGTIL